jgi:hypothetical protein
VADIVVIVADVIEQIEGLLASSPYRDATDEVVSYLKLVGDRERHIGALAGGPKLLESEALAQSYAGSFHREAFANVPMIDANVLVTTLEPLGVQDVRGFAKRLRASSDVIALKQGRTYVYPKFQFDPAQHRVRTVVAEVNRRLLANRDPWGALAWWSTENPRWGRRKPVEHPDDKRVVALVEADLEDGF